jgi:hypothetical protein
MPGFCPPQDYVFFADEAGISGDRFTVVGGFCVRRNMIPQIHASIEAYRERHNMTAELKWSRVSNQKFEEYKAFVDLFFALNNSNQIHFHALVFDSHKANHKKFNNGDSDVGLSKLYYQLIVHKFAKLYPSEQGMCVCLDHRNSSTPLNDLREMINSTLARDHGIPHRPVKQLVSQDSKADDLLQLNDVILGAVCHSRNGKHLLAETRPAKRDIAQLVLNQSGLTTFDENSPRNVHRFSVWQFEPRIKGR